MQSTDGAVGYDKVNTQCLQKQLRHDLISVCQSQDQCAAKLCHINVRSLFHW